MRCLYQSSKIAQHHIDKNITCSSKELFFFNRSFILGSVNTWNVFDWKLLRRVQTQKEAVICNRFDLLQRFNKTWSRVNALLLYVGVHGKYTSFRISYSCFVHCCSENNDNVWIYIREHSIEPCLYCRWIWLLPLKRSFWLGYTYIVLQTLDILRRNSEKLNLHRN